MSMRIAVTAVIAMAIPMCVPAEERDAKPPTYTVLYTFTGGADGGYPQYGGLIADAAGNLYGTATFGGDVNCPLVTYPGPGCGVVFKLDRASKQETVLYTFTDGTDGAQPWGGLIRDWRTGDLYGTAAFGGSQGNGVIFKVDPSGHETVLHPFSGGADGANPTGDLIRDAWGTLYGTTVTGGDLNQCFGYGCGVVFKQNPIAQRARMRAEIHGSNSDALGSARLTPRPSCASCLVDGFKVLHSFTGPATGDGANPTHGLIRDMADNVYGTTENGGSPACSNYEPNEAVETGVQGCGVVFKLDCAGKETLVYLFGAAPDGSDPRTSLIRDEAGNFYGTTFYGGVYGSGTVFKIDPRGHETVLYNFQGLTDGANPWGGLVRDEEGNLYGTTNHAGGSCYCGTVFKLDREGTYTVLHTFSGSDGQYPEAPLLLHRGALYGITSGGGTLSDGSSGTGTIFEIALRWEGHHRRHNW